MLTVQIWGYMTSLVQFQITAAANSENLKQGISITQPLFVTVLPYLSQNIYAGWEISRIRENILLWMDMSNGSSNDSSYKTYLCYINIILELLLLI